jgi:ribonuclease T2
MVEKFLLFVFLVFSSANAFASQAPQAHQQASPQPGLFDSYNLSITYHNDFCLQFPQDAECTTKPVLQGLSLHGLWPDKKDDPKNTYIYCGLPASSVKQWCDPSIDVKNQMSQEEFNALAAIQPGDISCLYNHEWYAHGTCSGLSVVDYFEDALTLAQRFLQLPRVNQLVLSSAGKTLDLATIQAALAHDLPAAGASAIVLCRQDKNSKAWYFSSFTVGLDKDNLMQFPAAASFAPLKPFPDGSGNNHPDTGNCPQTGILFAP